LTADGIYRQECRDVILSVEVEVVIFPASKSADSM